MFFCSSFASRDIAIDSFRPASMRFSLTALRHGEREASLIVVVTIGLTQAVTFLGLNPGSAPT